MTRSQKRMREMAADIIAECGPFARMAALFLASERDEEGDAEGAVLWTRIAEIVLRCSAEGGMERSRRLH